MITVITSVSNGGKQNKKGRRLKSHERERVLVHELVDATKPFLRKLASCVTGKPTNKEMFEIDNYRGRDGAQVPVSGS